MAREGGTAAIGQCCHLDAHVELLLHGFDVGDGTHHATGGLQLLQRGNGIVERVVNRR